MRSPDVHVSIDLDQIRRSAEEIRSRTQRPLIAVVKADAYGLGAERVVDCLREIADSFAWFSIDEARTVRAPGIVLGPPTAPAEAYAELGLLPAISTPREAERYRSVPVALNVDSGMQRFGCPPDEAAALLNRGNVREAFTHARSAGGAGVLERVCAGRVERLHAAATCLLECPQAWLDAVRPGLALYRGAVRVTSRLAAVRRTTGAVGYSGFECPIVGVILAGYSHGVRPGPVLINGRRQQVLEAGMNTSFVSADAADREGDEVVLLGEALLETTLAAHFDTRPHEILCRYTSMGVRAYRGAQGGANRRVA